MHPTRVMQGTTAILMLQLTWWQSWHREPALPMALNSSCMAFTSRPCVGHAAAASQLSGTARAGPSGQSMLMSCCFAHRSSTDRQTALHLHMEGSSCLDLCNLLLWQLTCAQGWHLNCRDDRLLWCTYALTGSPTGARRSAWEKLGNLPPEAAREQYVATVRRAVPEWRRQDDAEEQAQRPKAGQPMGPVMSSLAHNMDAADGAAAVCASWSPALHGILCCLNKQIAHLMRSRPCGRRSLAGGWLPAVTTACQRPSDHSSQAMPLLPVPAADEAAAVGSWLRTCWLGAHLADCRQKHVSPAVQQSLIWPTTRMQETALCPQVLLPALRLWCRVLGLAMPYGLHPAVQQEAMRWVLAVQVPETSAVPPASAITHCSRHGCSGQCCLLPAANAERRLHSLPSFCSVLQQGTCGVILLHGKQWCMQQMQEGHPKALRCRGATFKAASCRLGSCRVGDGPPLANRTSLYLKRIPLHLWQHDHQYCALLQAVGSLPAFAACTRASCAT